MHNAAQALPLKNLSCAELSFQVVCCSRVIYLLFFLSVSDASADTVTPGNSHKPAH